MSVFVAVLRGIGWVVGVWLTGMSLIAGLSALSMGEAPQVGVFVLFGVGVVLCVILSRTAKPEGEEGSNMPRGELKASSLPDDWSRALASKGITAAEIDRLVENAYSDPRGDVLPSRSDIFRAFELTPRHHVKVVILGQDPYPDRRRACGLAFSVPRGESIPYSLGRIFDKMENEFVSPIQRPTHGDLTHWAEQGVLLLNSALTVVEGRSGSQVKLWARFTRAVLEVVNESPNPTVFMLWGDDANALGDSIPLDEGRHKVIRSTHPRFEQASSYPRFQDTKPFVEANQFLGYQHQRGWVNWTLD